MGGYRRRSTRIILVNVQRSIVQEPKNSRPRQQVMRAVEDVGASSGPLVQDILARMLGHSTSPRAWPAVDLLAT